MRSLAAHRLLAAYLPLATPRPRRYNVSLQKQVDTLSGKKVDGLNVGKKSALETARERMRKLQAENDALRVAAQEHKAKQREMWQQAEEQRHKNLAKSTTCLLQ